MVDILEELKIKTDNCAVPGWATRAAKEIERLRDLLSAAKWPQAPEDRLSAQAEGKHPAPCARFCEANAFEIELRQLRRENERLKAQIMGPNAQAKGLDAAGGQSRLSGELEG